MKSNTQNAKIEAITEKTLVLGIDVGSETHYARAFDYRGIRKTEKPFVIGKNYRYKNYALGEKVRTVMEQYADGRLTAEQERDLRRTGFKFSIHIK